MATGPSDRFRRLSGLRARLLLLLGIAVIPAIALLLAGRSAERKATERELQSQVLNLARLTAQAHAQRIETARQLLLALATHSDIRGDAAACGRVVRELTRMYAGIYATIGRARHDGSVDCLALDGATSGMTIADRDYFQRAVSTGTFVAGDFMHGKIRRQPTLAFAQPLRDTTGAIEHVIFANVDLTVLSRDLEAQTRMEDAIISVLDRNGTLIARSTNADRFFGVSASAEQLRTMIEQGETLTTFSGPDGVRRLFAISAIRDRDHAIVGFATAGVAETKIAALLNPGARRDWFTVGLLALGLLLAGWSVSELLIRRPIAKLVRATGSLAAGDLDARTQPVGGVRELDELAAAFNQMAMKLQERELHLREGQRLEAIGQLAGGVAHDFNNLLTVIIGYADVLNAQVAAGSTEAEELLQLRTAADRAAQLTHQLLAFSRRQVLVPAPLQLNDVITDMVTLLRRTTGGDVVIEVTLDPALGQVYADRVQMEQVVLNLVINARDAMPSGGKVSIETHNTDHDGKGLVELTVADTGVGMDAETRARIFEPFFTTKGVKGTGLGLATVYGIVKQSGGDIACESQIGAGTHFHVRLPRHAAASPQPEAAPTPVAADNGSEAVLLVDDDEGVLAVLEKALTRKGYLVHAAGGAATALGWLTGGLVPDVIITDIRMPGISGDAFARETRRLMPDVPIIFMSGDATSGFNQSATGRSLFLQKPVTGAILVRAVRELLERGPLRPQ